jgi:hypothetical protein
MKTITAPNGKQYEVDDGWEPLPVPTDKVNRWILLYDDGTMSPEYFVRELPRLTRPIAWRPIVPPKEVRWRAEESSDYWYIHRDGTVCREFDHRGLFSARLFSIGNYFRTREEAEASNKAKVMRDPESEVGR